MNRSVHVVLPGDVDDDAVPSGGNTYDRRVCQGLAATGWVVHEIAVPGGWPRPDSAAVGALDRALLALPDGTLVLLDGLVACGVPDVVGAQAGRLRVAVLVHMPLADDTALPADVAIDLDARERQTLGGADAVIATSRSSARRLVRHHGLAASRVRVAAPGTDAAPVATGTDGVSNLLCVAAITEGKGQDLLVEALAEVADLPWRCQLVGPLRRDPAYVARLRQLIGRRAIGDRVRLAGPLTGERLTAAYAAADLFVLASRHETYGMVVTEALARGLPVVATSAGALPDTLGHAPDGTVPGLLVPPDDVSAFADAVRRWFGDQDLRRRLRTAALQRRGTLRGWADTARAVSNVLAQVCQSTRGAA